MNKPILPFLFLGIISFFSISALANQHLSVLQTSPAAMPQHSMGNGDWTGIIELPFLLVSVFFAFATAAKLKDGKVGRGMRLLAWGFLVMAVGHLHMQVEHFTGINLFAKLLGKDLGSLAWSLALLTTWGLSALGWYNIFDASRIQITNNKSQISNSK